MKKRFSGLTLCLCAALAQGPLFADGVARTAEAVQGGCRVTLAWDFAGSPGSALVIEERFPAGWLVDASTVPFGSLDASWLSEGVARFAVKSGLVAAPGSISFTIAAPEGASGGPASGDWMVYLDGRLKKGVSTGARSLSAIQTGLAGNGGAGTQATDTRSGLEGVVRTPVAISSFRLLDGAVELSYRGVEVPGVLAVEGCEGLGAPWNSLKRTVVSPGDGTVLLESNEAGSSRFFRLYLLTEK